LESFGDGSSVRISVSQGSGCPINGMLRWISSSIRTMHRFLGTNKNLSAFLASRWVVLLRFVSLAAILLVGIYGMRRDS